MKTLIYDDVVVRIPDGVNDLASFRRWAHSDQFPETGRICFLNGNVWMDMSPEQIFTHGAIKNEFAFLLTGIQKKTGKGRYFPDRTLLTNEDANLSCEPDGTYVFRQSFEQGKIVLVEGAIEGFIELKGTPDLVLEVVSDSSVRKDLEVLRELYWRAQISEYWLVDARRQRLEFDILHWHENGYVETRKQAGWVNSHLFGCALRLACEMDSIGHPVYTLEMR